MEELSQSFSKASKKWRKGFTTGACAAAAAKAAMRLLAGLPFSPIEEVANPKGQVLQISVESAMFEGNYAVAKVIKDAGDDPDITNGATIVAKVAWVLPDGQQEYAKTPKPIGSDFDVVVTIRGGLGVGIVTRPGLAIYPGEAAINPVPRLMIKKAVSDILDCTGKSGAVEVEISVPGGQELALKTLNPRLGISGGISILGTTGIVEPMSEDAYRTSLRPQLGVIKGAGYDIVVLVPGRMGQDYAIKLGLPEDAVALTSNFVGYMLEETVGAGLSKVLLVGHIGKLVKVAAGIFHTHNRVADGRLETIIAQVALAGGDLALLKQIEESGTADGAADILKSAGMERIFPELAQKASRRAMDFVRRKLEVGTILLALDGSILGYDENAAEMARQLGGLEAIRGSNKWS